MVVCPYDCGHCVDPSCRRDGCRHIEAALLLVCDHCGEPVTCVNCAHMCVACVRVVKRTGIAVRRK